MSGPLALARPDEPRLDATIERNLRRMRIAQDWAPTVRALATGTQRASSLRCCGSGCRPCVQDIARCTAQCLLDLQAPEPGAALESPPVASGPLGGRGRALARTLLDRLRAGRT